MEREQPEACSAGDTPDRLEGTWEPRWMGRGWTLSFLWLCGSEDMMSALLASHPPAVHLKRDSFLGPCGKMTSSLGEHHVLYKGIPGPPPLLYLPLFPFAQPSLTPDFSVESTLAVNL